jgi:hypothetical protein
MGLSGLREFLLIEAGLLSIVGNRQGDSSLPLTECRELFVRQVSFSLSSP